MRRGGAGVSESPIQVLKFGSSVLASPEHLANAVHEIYRWWRVGKRVVAVVSAIGSTTDRLLAEAKRLSARPDEEATAELLATGEAESVALLKLALAKAGIPASALDAARLGVRTRGPLLDADPVGLDADALHARLRQRPVLVVPGFVGRHDDGRLSLLGRGGSDLTALFLAARLGAECRLLKDVPGLFEWDPASEGPAPRRFATISFVNALELDGAILQKKALAFAQSRGLNFLIGRCAAARQTLVGATTTAIASDPEPLAPLRVGLLGLGTVGVGVAAHVLRQPERFELVGAVVRDAAKRRAIDLPAGRIYTHPDELLAQKPDVLIDCAGNPEAFAMRLIGALEQNIRVITADKALLADSSGDLAEWLAGDQPRLRGSAAVAGVVPALETVRRLSLPRLSESSSTQGVRIIEGVLNGTTNFVLERVAEGCTLEEAVREAQELGFSETDPSADLDGLDAQRKLALLVQAAWGETLRPDHIACTGIRAAVDLATRASLHERVRLVARAERFANGRIIAEVAPRLLPLDHAMAQAQGEGNAIVIETEDGMRVSLAGKGAGRWPTAEAVIADLLDVWRERCVDSDVGTQDRSASESGKHSASESGKRSTGSSSEEGA
jgi:homoserine dehydrogenase